jgi:hypothetical protein
MANKPIWCRKIGVVEVAIFAKDMGDWTTHNIAVQTKYKKDGQWKALKGTFQPAQAPVAAQLLTMASTWLADYQAKLAGPPASSVDSHDDGGGEDIPF